MERILICIAITFVGLCLIGYIAVLIDDKVRAKRNEKWAKDFMEKVDKFQF